ncbi:MAG TPA: multidrug effflux MFS transporter [Alphaproteobacteria bacterium]|jgi:DHA1 family bicyclomycin/chloramphenicol resistance-like MFS transporter
MPARADFPRLAVLMILVAFAALSVDITIPVMNSFAAAFAVSGAAAQLTLSVFVLAFATTHVVAGPLSDRFGRRPVLIGGVALYTLASIACVFAQSIDELVAARFVQGIGCCAGPVVGRAIVRDLYGGARAAKVLAYMSTVMGFVPGVAPIIGGTLVEAFGWRAIFVALLGFGVVAFLGCLFVLDETNKWRDPGAVRPRRLALNYLSFLGERSFLAYVAATGFTYAAMLSFHSLSAFVLIEQMGVRTGHYGYWFLGIVLGYVAGAFTVGRLHGRIAGDRLIAIGLGFEVAGAALLAALGWARVDAPWAVIGPMVLFMYGAGFVFPNAAAGAIAPYQTKAGAASALLGFVQFMMGAVIATVVTRFHTGTQVTLVTGVLVCALLGLASFRLLIAKPKPALAAAE